MATRLSVATRNASVAAITALLNSGGTVEIRTGSQPATADTAASGTLLGTLGLSTTAFGAPSNGSAAVNAITSDTSADATGTAGWFRAKKSDGSAVIDGSITATGNGGDMTLDNVSVVAGGVISVTSWTISQSAG